MKVNYFQLSSEKPIARAEPKTMNPFLEPLSSMPLDETKWKMEKI